MPIINPPMISESGIVKLLDTLGSFSFIFAGTLFALLFLSFLTKRLAVLIRKSAFPLSGKKEKRVKTITNVIEKIGYIIILSISLAAVASKLGISIGPLIASAGIVGLAIGFGAQSLVKDIISGFFFIASGQFNEGDVVRINDIEGMVEEIGLRTVVIRDLAGASHIIPNSSINIVSNLTKDWSRVNLNIAISTNNEIDHVLAVLSKLADDIVNDPTFKDRILERPEILGVESIEPPNRMVIKILVKTRPMKQWNTKRELLYRIKKEFENEKIALA